MEKVVFIVRGKAGAQEKGLSGEVIARLGRKVVGKDDSVPRWMPSGQQLFGQEILTITL
jgi:hypothetical protein